MKYNILLNKDDDTRQIEDEEKSKFVRHVLEQMGLPVDEFWDQVDRALTTEEKIKLREILHAYNVIIIDSLSGHLQIYVENDLVGEWHKPYYKLKTDLRQINPYKRLYLEMTVECWNVFEGQSEEE